MEKIIYDFVNIVEESRLEDRLEHYIKLRNTLDLLENLLKENKSSKETINILTNKLEKVVEENEQLKVQCENEFNRGFFMKVAENYEKTNAEIINVPSLYVPKSVIQNKIKNEHDKILYYEKHDNQSMCTHHYRRQQVLQELLEERNK